MQHKVQAWGLGHVVKGALLGNVGHDNDLQTIGLVLVRLTQLLGFILGPHRGDDFIVLGEELLKDVGYRNALEEMTAIRVSRMSIEHRIHRCGDELIMPGDRDIPAMKPEPPS